MRPLRRQSRLKSFATSWNLLIYCKLSMGRKCLKRGKEVFFENLLGTSSGQAGCQACWRCRCLLPSARWSSAWWSCPAADLDYWWLAINWWQRCQLGNDKMSYYISRCLQVSNILHQVKQRICEQPELQTCKKNSRSLRSVADSGTEIVNDKLHLFDVPKKLFDRQQWLLPQFLRRQAMGWQCFIQGNAPSPFVKLWYVE